MDANIKLIIYFLLICLIICSILKMIKQKKNEKIARSIGRTKGKNICIKDKDGFIVCKENYSDINYRNYEKVGTRPLYKRPEPENECFFKGGKLYCRDPPFNPYSKYFPYYAKHEVINYQNKIYPYQQYPYSLIQQSFNFWG